MVLKYLWKNFNTLIDFINKKLYFIPNRDNSTAEHLSFQIMKEIRAWVKIKENRFRHHDPFMTTNILLGHDRYHMKD